MDEREQLLERLNALRERIRRICADCGRDPASVRIVPASKTRSADLLNLLPDLGITELGENRVKEWTEKLPFADPRIRWHFIGQLQTNKVKYVVGRAALIQSLDRIELADEIQRRAEKENVVVPCLVELNAARKEGRGGVLPEEASAFVHRLAAYRRIEIRGLMTVLPQEGAEEAARETETVFRMIASEKQGFDELSMGMSGDLELAILHGATIVRPGRALFGERV